MHYLVIGARRLRAKSTRSLLRGVNRINERLGCNVRTAGTVDAVNKGIYTMSDVSWSSCKQTGRYMVFQRPKPTANQYQENIPVAMSCITPGNGVPRSEQDDGRGGCTETGIVVGYNQTEPESHPAFAEEQKLWVSFSLYRRPEPQILLMDEPCSALDPAAPRRWMVDW